MHNFFTTFFIVYLICFIVNTNKSEAQTIDTLKTVKHHFELSFGQSLLFISNKQLATIRNQASIIVPTSSFLFFVEFRPEKRLKIPMFFNLPTETKQYLVNGGLINEKASPTFGTGIEFKVFKIKIDERSVIDFEVGPLASFIFDSRNKIRIAPLVAGRFRIKRGENFIMYFGVSYSFGINALGLLYGTGTIF